MTIGVAESCTGGLMAKRLTDVAGASQVFLGGIVSYTNQVKAGMLHVPQHLLDQFGAVSPEVALAMAEGARKALGVTSLLPPPELPGRTRTIGTTRWAPCSWPSPPRTAPMCVP